MYLCFEGSEQAYAKMDRPKSLLHAKSPIVERLQEIKYNNSKQKVK